MADTGTRAREAVAVLERTQVGVALLVLLAGALLVAVTGDLDASSGLLGPLVVVLLAGGGTLAVLDILDAPVRFWGFLDSDLGVTAQRLVGWVLRLVELGVAILVGLSAAGLGFLGTLPGSPQGSGVLLAGLLGIQLAGLLLAVLVVLRVGLDAVLASLE